MHTVIILCNCPFPCMFYLHKAYFHGVILCVCWSSPFRKRNKHSIPSLTSVNNFRIVLFLLLLFVFCCVVSFFLFFFLGLFLFFFSSRNWNSQITSLEWKQDKIFKSSRNACTAVRVTCYNKEPSLLEFA